MYDVEDEVVFKNADYTDLSAWQGVGDGGVQRRFVSRGFDDQIEVRIICQLCHCFHAQRFRDGKSRLGSAQDRQVFRAADVF